MLAECHISHLKQEHVSDSSAHEAKRYTGSEIPKSHDSRLHEAMRYTGSEISEHDSRLHEANRSTGSEINKQPEFSGTHHTARSLRRFPMLKTLISYLTLISLSHAARASPPESPGQTNSQRAAPGALPVSLVLQEASLADQGHTGISPAPAPNDWEHLSTPRTASCEGGESIWDMGQMPSMRTAAQLYEIRANQSETNIEEGKALCCINPNGCFHDEGKGIPGGIGLIGDSVVPSRTAGDSLDPRTGDHPEPGADPGPHYPGPAAAPEPDGLHAAPSLVPGPDADRSKSTSDAAGRRHQHGESQHGRVVPPLSSTSTFSLSSTAEKLSSQSHGIDWGSWFVSPFSPDFCTVLSHFSSFTLLWHPRDGNGSKLVWKSSFLVDELCFSDLQDDHEFFLTKPQKRAITAGAEAMNSFGILSSLHAIESAERTQGPQETKNNTGRTSKPQEAKNNNTERTSAPQETKNNTGRTSGPQEKAEKTQGLQVGNIRFGNSTVSEEEVGQVTSFLGGHFSPLGLSQTTAPRSKLAAMGSHRKLKICELFSPPRVTAETQERWSETFSTTEPPSFDKTTGWEFNSYQCRKDFWEMLEKQAPDVVGMSPECKPFSIIMNSNWNRMSEDEAKRIKTGGISMMLFCIQVAKYQLERGRYFYIEQPSEATSWELNAMEWLRNQENVFLALFDQCEAGLSVSQGKLSRKSTGLITNHAGITAEVSKFQCKRDHQHVQLQSGLPKKAQQYPQGLVEAILRGMTSSPSFDHQCLAAWEEDSDEEVEDQALEPQTSHLPAPQTPGPVMKRTSEDITRHQKELLYRLHANTGHAPKPQMLMMLKAAGAKDNIMKFVQEKFQCDQCMHQKRPIQHKQVAFPKTLSFNDILGIDYFFISFQGKTHAFLNVVCHGTNFQQVGWLKNYEGGSPNSKDTWLLFQSMWVRPFGLPRLILSDQGSEFKQHFERKLEQHGVLQVVCDAAAPWQNGRCERHGSGAKQRVEEDLQSGQATVETSAELEDLMNMLVGFKNKYFHRGGFSPFQLVFGISPRLPADLPSDDPTLLPALQDLQGDPLNQDTAAAEFSRTNAIREKARQLCMRSTLRDKAQLGMRKYAHRERTWSPGQWVYCWRKMTGTGGGHATRARWVGPGLVVQQLHHTVWVAMRSRIWKCSSDQLRPANEAETLGAELMTEKGLEQSLKDTKGQRATAIDVASEGPPPPEAIDEASVPAQPAPIRLDQQQQILPTIPEGEEPDPRSSEIPSQDTERHHGVGILARAARAPATPTSPLERRRPSAQTVEEPHVEPMPLTPSVRSSSSDQGNPEKRLKQGEPSDLPAREAEGAVRKRIAEIEQERLEREALKYLRQMNREERARRRENPLAEIAASSNALPEGTQTHDTVPPPVPDDQDLWATSCLDQIPCFHIAQEGDRHNFFAKPKKAKNSEFCMKNASKEERKGFAESDKAEWKSIIGMNAVRILSKEEAKEVKEKFPHRIISSRMIRRKKPTPGVGCFKYKSRWCLHGHQDPDTGTFEVFSPTPCTEAITLFFQICLNESLKASFLDVKNAFCQSNPLKRPRGRIYATPCEGTGLDPSEILEIIVPVYGLDDAPLQWHQTLLDFFFSLGFERTLLEPCWLVKRDKHNRIIGQVIIEVDDLNFGLTESYIPELREALEQRFTFGKWEENEADFAGRHVKVEQDRVTMHQEKYILEKIQTIKLLKGKLSDKTQRLEQEDFEL